MMQSGTNQPILLTTSSYNIEQLSNIRPRLCTLHKWSHFDGYGIHLSCNEHWHGLHIEDIEPNSPAESAGLLRGDIILAVNGHLIENKDFFLIFSFIQQELKQNQIRFLVLDPYSARLAQHYQLNIDENHENCIRTETSKYIKSSNNSNQALAQNISRDGLDDINKLFSDLDLHNNLQSEPRICSIILRSNTDPIGISLQSDTDFSHIITQVQSNSPADRAGIEQDDCIISLNNTLLLQIPFEDVLYYLAKIRNQRKLDFLVAKKSYLLKLSQSHLTLNTNTQIFTLSNLIKRNRTSILLDAQTLGQSERTQEQQTITDEQYNCNRNISKHGKILKDVGPARNHRFSWSATSNRDELKELGNTRKDILNFLQVGMTNPSLKSQTHRILSHIPSVDSSDDGQSYNSSKELPSPNLAMKSNCVVHIPSSLPKHNKTVQSSPISCIENQDNHQTSQSNLHLATIPLSELPNHGYELHNIKLMKPTETIPVGLQLTKQTDSCQYIMTDIVEQSQADLAGLKVDDWLIKIEDKDIRLTDLKDIYQLFNNLSFINMVIARKKSSVDLSNPNLDKIRHITLKEISELYFDSFISDTNDQIHFISNIQPISIAYQSGLRNNDRILTINGIDVTKTSKEDLQLMILKNKSIQLTVINDSKYFQSIENFKYNKIQKILPPIIYETIDHRKLNHFNNILFIDDQGPVYLKHCIVKPESSYNALGFSLYYKDDFHIINNIEKNFPGYNYGLRNHDIILFVNKKSIQQLLSNDLTMLIRSLVITNKIIDLIILKKNDLQRYKNYQTKKSINWNSILSNIYNEGSIDSGDGGTRVVQQYQRQRNKELSYTLRLCHLNTTNIIDEPPVSSLGFEITGDPEYEYPIISYVESRLPGERAGLQKDDILLKVNDRKTKGANFDKIKKTIDKAKRDGRLEMLVVDKDTFNYCIQTKKKFKEPYIKVKHIFPRGRSSIDYQSLPLIAARASLISMNGTSSFNVQRLSIQDDLKLSNFEATIDPVRSLSQQEDNEISTNESIVDSVLNAINNSFQNTELEKPINRS